MKSLFVTLPPLVLASLSQAAHITRHSRRAHITPERDLSGSGSVTHPGDVIVQMFEWNWDSIAAECTNFLGPAGYTYVQTSPPQEHITGTQWWTDYQPVSYQIASKRGSRDQFAAMINTCHQAGVKIIADTVMNHMSAGAGVGTAGTNYTQFNYTGVYEPQDFHYCGLEPGNTIVNYNNRLEVQTCELVGLADLNTGSEYVRSRLAAYVNDLLSLGVDGLRFDAAKHMAATDIANITSRFTAKPYITQETIYGGDEAINPTEYVGIGDVQEFRYTTALQSAFLGGGISNLQNLNNNGWVSGLNANVFVANHDTERNGGSLNYNSPNNTYITATIFSLAYPFGKPTVLSSYSGFSDIDVGSPNGGAGTCSGTGGANGWICQHRFVAFSGMVGFRNNVGVATLTNWVSPSAQKIAFERQGKGFVALNNEDKEWTAIFNTTLPDGDYCDVVGGGVNSGSCVAAGFKVVKGSFGAIVSPRSAIAIHTGAQGSAASDLNTVWVSFTQTASTAFGETVYVVGNISALGAWEPSSAVPLSSSADSVWSGAVAVAPNTAFEYGFVKQDVNGTFTPITASNQTYATTSAVIQAAPAAV